MKARIYNLTTNEVAVVITGSQSAIEAKFDELTSPITRDRYPEILKYWQLNNEDFSLTFSDFGLSEVRQTWHIVASNIKSFVDNFGEHTYQVIDQPSNRFNFCDLVEISEPLIEDADDGTEYLLSEELPEDVQHAVEVMRTNDVKIEDFTGVVTYDEGDTTYYLLTW